MIALRAAKEPHKGCEDFDLCQMSQQLALNRVNGCSIASRRCQHVKPLGRLLSAQRSVVARAEQDNPSAPKAEQVRIATMN